MASELARVIAGAKPGRKLPPHLTAKPDAKAPEGQGGRFAAMEDKVAKEPGVRNPAAVAAAIGRKALGAKKFNGLAVKGKKN